MGVFAFCLMGVFAFIVMGVFAFLSLLFFMGVFAFFLPFFPFCLFFHVMQYNPIRHRMISLDDYINY